MSRLKQNLLDIFIVVFSGLIIVTLVSWVANHISENMAPHFAAAIIEFLIPYSNYITWCDIIAMFFAWVAGVFFNKSLHRLMDNFY